jgi:hypothetical protein
LDHRIGGGAQHRDIAGLALNVKGRIGCPT